MAAHFAYSYITDIPAIYAALTMALFAGVGRRDYQTMVEWAGAMVIASLTTKPLLATLLVGSIIPWARVTTYIISHSRR